MEKLLTLQLDIETMEIQQMEMDVVQHEQSKLDGFVLLVILQLLQFAQKSEEMEKILPLLQDTVMIQIQMIMTDDHQHVQ